MKKKILLTILLIFSFSACSLAPAIQSNLPGIFPMAAGDLSRNIPTTDGGSKAAVPVFDLIIMIMLENKGFDQVIGSSQMPFLNKLAQDNVLLTNYYAVTHPSLPNYIALVAGGTFGINRNCTGCFIDQTSLPDLIEASGRTWKTYQEDLPAPCFLGSAGNYAQKHNPFVYFDPIRKNTARCQRSIVPLNRLDADLAALQLPDFAFIVPNMCNSSHNCDLSIADQWLKEMISKLQSSQEVGLKSLIYIAFEEADKKDKSSCCSLGNTAGGRVPAILISPLAQPDFQDDTEYSHYSLLKTILLSWSLPMLGFTNNPSTLPITAPWK